MEELRQGWIETPVGKMQVLSSDKGICFLEFVKKDRNVLLERRLSKWFSEAKITDKESEYTRGVRKWLKSYFAGEFTDFEIPLDLRGTDFEKRVWKELLKVKLGYVESYSGLAKRVGKAKASRAIGGASRRNPVAIVVPCHRIIGKSGSLTGYGGGLSQKEWLLQHEGADVIPSE